MQTVYIVFHQLCVQIVVIVYLTHRAIVTVRSNSTENETVVHFMLFQWKLYATLVKSFEKWIWFLRCLHRWFLIGLLSVWKSWKCSTTLGKWFRKFLLWSYEKYKTFDKTNINLTMNNWARRTFKLKRELTFKERKSSTRICWWKEYKPSLMRTIENWVFPRENACND